MGVGQRGICPQKLSALLLICIGDYSGEPLAFVIARMNQMGYFNVLSNEQRKKLITVLNFR